MKKLIYLAIVSVLASCGGSIPEFKRYNIKVDGKDVSIIKVNNNLEVMPYDMSRVVIYGANSHSPSERTVYTYNWNEAKKACEDLGDGWRLPTIDELMVIGEYADTFDIVMHRHYWSSTEDEDSEPSNIKMQTMNKHTPTEYDDRKYYIGSGGVVPIDYEGSGGVNFVRAVRSLD